MRILTFLYGDFIAHAYTFLVSVLLLACINKNKNMNIYMYLKKRHERQLAQFDKKCSKKGGKKFLEQTRKIRRIEKMSLRRARPSGFTSRGFTSHGFTLIEILVVIGIIAVLAAIVLVAVNPSRQFKLARDSQRVSNVESILSTVGQNIAEHKGLFTCNGVVVTIPSTATDIKSVSSSSPDGFDLAPCVVPDYISSLPFDPSSSTARYATSTDYNTAYVIYEDSNGRITASSTGEITPSISATR
jgi:prepilin-type N-terminal cleavage/methylation domain-containing protein